MPHKALWDLACVVLPTANRLAEEFMLMKGGSVGYWQVSRQWCRHAEPVCTTASVVVASCTAQAYTS